MQANIVCGMCDCTPEQQEKCKNNLLPCPFCSQGGDMLTLVSVIHFQEDSATSNSERVKCTGCGATAPLLNWNRRV